MIKIAVTLTDGTFAVVSADELNLLLKQRKILSFLRSDGWVRVGYDTLREARNSRYYDGKDRRNTLRIEKTLCDHCGREFVTPTGDSIYSVIVTNNGCSIQIIEGELIHGAYHFCSDMCMFLREQGVICIEQLEDDTGSDTEEE